MNNFIEIPKCVLFAMVLFASFMGSRAYAQGGPWTLDQCVDYAYENNLSIRQSLLEVRNSQNTYTQSQWERGPALDANISQGWSFGRTVDPFSNQFVSQSFNFNNSSLVLSWTIFAGGQIRHNIQQNNYSLTASQLNVEQVKYDVALNVATAYLNVLLNQELLNVAIKQREATQEQLDRTQKLFNAGSVAINQVVDLQAQLANDELNIVNAENQVLLSKLNLMQVMNLPAADDFDLAITTLPDIGRAEIYPQAPAEIYVSAEQTWAGIKRTEMSIRSSEASVEAAQGRRYPTLSFSANLSSGYSSARTLFDQSISSQTQIIGVVDGTGQTVSTTVPVVDRVPRDYPFLQQYGDNFGQGFSFNLRIPIFNRRQISTGIQNSKLQVERNRLEAQNVRVQLRQNIEQSYNDARAATISYNAQRQQLEALQLAFETTERRFNAGAASAVDFNIAKINRDRAEADLVRAKYNHIFRQKVLDYYQNKPITLD
ncbi:TolC family protein [Eisenibacter elegans]|uniref:TolC family protein n=1 Tax=Eisenibacter elegans TaxID=997 RepID=UPI0004075398|nr:TolC family protein [Eisenibacter elegans]